MTNEEYQWHINLIKDRYNALNLTFEQAEKIYTYEKDKDIFSEKSIFSAWEEWDYELTIFRDILNAEQFNNYEVSLKEIIKHYEQTLIQQDKEDTNEILYFEELINYYETRFLPDIFNTSILRFSFLQNDKSKIEYLKTEYNRFLNDTKKELLSNHFRYNRTFKPNELKVALLRHKLSYYIPNYNHFKYMMDEPTKAVALYLYSKLQNLPENIEEIINRKFHELKEFCNELYKKHYTNSEGWHVVIAKNSAEEEKEFRIMTYLLLDEQKYGC